ncbi:MAG TPA: hypothetical protein VJ623_07665 [Holophagaceae bacterium]|nr:hypothetical protein [Holophagaceae bacterium]
MIGLSSKPRPLLVVAHPGHELRVHGWLERARPRVAVLTDGSGGAAVSRLEASRALVAQAGAEPTALFGVAPDRAFYGAILEGDVAFFAGLVDRLRALVAAERPTVLVSDAAEGFNPTHDLCHALTALVARLTNLPHLDFPLEGPPDTPGAALRLELDAEAHARKLARARAYSALAKDLQEALDQHGAAAFAVECLHEARPGPAGKPYYETYGERMVAAGRYATVLRRAEHVAPLLGRVAAAVLEPAGVS